MSLKLTFSLKVSSLEAGRTVYSRPVKNKWPEKRGKVQQRIALTSKGAAVLY